MGVQLNILQIFKTSRDIYIKNFKNIAISVMFVFIPFYVAVEFIPDSLLPSAIEFLTAADANSLLKYIYLIMALSIIFEPLIIGAVATISFKWLKEEQKATIPEILDNSLVKWLKLSFTAFLFAAIIMITATLILPAIYFSVIFAFYGIITAVSDKWGFHSFAESSRLVKGRWMRTAGMLLLFWTMAYTFEIAINSLVFIIEYPLILSIIADVIIKLIVSYFYVVNAVFCYSMMISKEQSQDGVQI